jgi:hypothetical protein
MDLPVCRKLTCDRSRPDAQFVFFALKQGRTPEDVAAKLMEVSPRAQASGVVYVSRTVAAGIKYLAKHCAIVGYPYKRDDRTYSQTY